MLHSFCQRKANNRVNVRGCPPVHAEVSGCRPGSASAQGGVLSGWSRARSAAWCAGPGCDGLGRACPGAGGLGAGGLPAALLLPPVMALGQSPTPTLCPWGAPVLTPNIPRAELHPDAEGVSGSWSGSPPGSLVCGSDCFEKNHELPHARLS